MTAETPTLTAALKPWYPVSVGAVAGSAADARNRAQLADAAMRWMDARLADPAAVEAVAERISWDGGDMTRWIPDAIEDHNRWSWRGDGHGSAMREGYRQQATAALEAVRALLVGGGEA